MIMKKDRRLQCRPSGGSLLYYCYLSWDEQTQKIEQDWWDYCEWVMKTNGIKRILQRTQTFLSHERFRYYCKHGNCTGFDYLNIKSDDKTTRQPQEKAT